MLMIFAFAFVYQIFPARSTPLTPPSDPLYIPDLLYHMTLPLITIVLVSFSAWSYIVKYFIVGILQEDYIAAKMAIGLPKKRIVYSHALKNAGPPIITAIAISLASSFGGAIIIEAVFDWPGMGKLYYDAISVMDVPIIIGLTYVFTLIFVITIFLTDIIYAFSRSTSESRMTIEVISRTTIFRKFTHSRGGIAGAIIIVVLILMTLYAVFYIPLDSFKQWNNPDYWIDYPKAAAPAWTNIGLKLPEHVILTSDQAVVSSMIQNGIHIVTHTYAINFNYDSYPTDFMLPYTVKIRTNTAGLADSYN